MNPCSLRSKVVQKFQWSNIIKHKILSEMFSIYKSDWQPEDGAVALL